MHWTDGDGWPTRAISAGALLILVVSGVVTAAAQPLPGGVFLAAGDVDGDGLDEVITGPGPGLVAQIRVFDYLGNLLLPYQVYDAGFQGGVRVAACDFDGDGRTDVLSAAGPGGGPHVRLLKFDAAFAYLGDLASFLAYDPGFVGGLFVACGDIDGDGVPDIVTGVDAGGGPHVRVFRYTPGTLGNVTGLADLFVYDPGFRGGVRVAAGNVDGSDRASLVTGAGPGGGPHVRVLRWDGTAFGETASFFAFDAGLQGGIFVSAGDVIADGLAEIITTPDVGGAPQLTIWGGDGSDLGVTTFAFDPTFTGGVRTAVGPSLGTPLFAGQGPGGTFLVERHFGGGVGPVFPAY
jgi:hypothetical protein